MTLVLVTWSTRPSTVMRTFLGLPGRRDTLSSTSSWVRKNLLPGVPGPISHTPSLANSNSSFSNDQMPWCVICMHSLFPWPFCLDVFCHAVWRWMDGSPCKYFSSTVVKLWNLNINQKIHLNHRMAPRTTLSWPFSSPSWGRWWRCSNQPPSSCSVVSGKKRNKGPTVSEYLITRRQVAYSLAKEPLWVYVLKLCIRHSSVHTTVSDLSVRIAPTGLPLIGLLQSIQISTHKLQSECRAFATNTWIKWVSRLCYKNMETLQRIECSFLSPQCSNC